MFKSKRVRSSSILAVLFLTLVSLQWETNSNQVNTIVEKEGITVKYGYSNVKDNPVINLTFINDNNHDVVVNWDNEITFGESEVVQSNGNVKGKNVMKVEANSSSIYTLPTVEVSTVLASLPVTNIELLNLTIKK